MTEATVQNSIPVSSISLDKVFRGMRSEPNGVELVADNGAKIIWFLFALDPEPVFTKPGEYRIKGWEHATGLAATLVVYANSEHVSVSSRLEYLAAPASSE